MTLVLIDDQLLGKALRGTLPRALTSKQLYTTGHWYVRLCQAVLGADERTGILSRPFADLPPTMLEKATVALLELPESIGLLSLRELAPTIASLRKHHRLNMLAVEVLAAATVLKAEVFLSAPSPLLEQALKDEHLRVNVSKRKRL